MSDLLPTILIAIGSALLLTQRDERVGLVAFLAQWLGMAWIVWSSTAPGAGTYPASIEGVTAVITVAIMGLTIFRPRPATGKKDKRTIPPAGPSSTAQRGIQDWLWLWGLALLVGVAGYGLAGLTNLDVPRNNLLGFYWLVLPSMLLIVLEGSRSAVKLGLALLSLCNAACLFLYLIAVATPGAGILGILALSRLALGVLVSYLWYVLAARYDTHELNVLFDRRDGIFPTSTALVVKPGEAAPDAPEEDPARHE
ncbi:MAG TPA: hypothetical protein VLQ48_07155 [Chloroflexia bacterium]|nr:hypothetical protein [Chloroflexia bacterium]